MSNIVHSLSSSGYLFTLFWGLGSCYSRIGRLIGCSAGGGRDQPAPWHPKYPARSQPGPYLKAHRTQ